MTPEELKQKSVKIRGAIANKQKRLWRLYGLKRATMDLATKKAADRYEKKIAPLAKEKGALEKKRDHFQVLCRENRWCEIGWPHYGTCSLCGFTRRPERSGIGDQAHP